MQPTHGPWEYGFPKIDGVEMRECDCQVSAGGFLIANVSHGGMYPEEPFGSAQREANARFISAAHDLLAALRGVLRVADRATVEFDAARAAIAKATGLTEG